MTIQRNFSLEEIRAAIAEHGSVSAAALALNLKEQTLTDWVEGKAKFFNDEKAKEAPATPTTKKKAKPIDECAPDSLLDMNLIQEYNRFVITCAQNNADIHEPFFQALLRYCDYNNALLIVIPIRYKNVTAYISKNDYEVEWPAQLKPYYLNHELKLNENLVVLGDFKIQATSTNPLSGVGPVAKKRSAIIGHSLLEMTMIPTPMDELPRKLLTTGSISRKHYSSSKVGMLAAFHHTTGAAIVETDGDLFWTRQINALEDGSFCDLDVEYFPNKEPEAGNQVEALVCGDTHVQFADKNVIQGRFAAPNSIYNVCKPKKVFQQDVLDFYSANHHHKKDVFTKYAKLQSGLHSVEKELKGVVKYHNTYCTGPDTEWYYIGSNHNDALTRWLNEADPKEDPENALIYHKLQVFMLENTKMGPFGTEYPDPLEYYMRSRVKNPGKVFFPGRDRKLLVMDIDLSQHGDVGPNGAKGSLNGFAKTGYKTITGHGHSPGIKFGAFRVGTGSLLKLDYNRRGYSSWFQTDCLVYKNGKRSLVDYIGGRWRA